MSYIDMMLLYLTEFVVHWIWMFINTPGSFVDLNINVTMSLLTHGDAQTREQTSVPDLYVLTVVFLALKKLVFLKKKFFPKNCLCYYVTSGSKIVA